MRVLERKGQERSRLTATVQQLDREGMTGVGMCREDPNLARLPADKLQAGM